MFEDNTMFEDKDKKNNSELTWTWLKTDVVYCCLCVYYKNILPSNKDILVIVYT